MKRQAALYCRVSSYGQDTGDPWASLPRQEEALRQLAEREQAQVVKVYHEVYSGVSLDRPDFNDLMERARRGDLHAIYVVSFDRLTRAGSMAEVEQLRRELIDLGVDLISPSQRWEFSNPEHDTPDTEFSFNVQAAAASFDRRKIVYRLKKGLDAKAKAGGDYGSRMAYGYVRQFDPTTGAKSYAIDEAKAAVVRRIFDEYLSGLGVIAIARGLNADGHPSPAGKRWERATVRNITRNATYAGLTEYLKPWRQKDRKHRMATTIVPSRVYPAIVSVDTWRAARAARERRKVNPRAHVQEQHPLSGIARCAGCGATMSVTCSRGTYLYYRCGSTSRPELECQAPQQLPYQQAHDAVLAVLRSYLPTLANPKHKKRKAVASTESQAIADTRRRVAAIEQELANLGRLLGQGVLSDTAYSLASTGAEAELLRLQASLLITDQEAAGARDQAERRAGLVRMADHLHAIAFTPDELRGLFIRALDEVRFTRTRDTNGRRRVHLQVALIRLRTGDEWRPEA